MQPLAVRCFDPVIRAPPDDKVQRLTQQKTEPSLADKFTVSQQATPIDRQIGPRVFQQLFPLSRRGMARLTQRFGLKRYRYAFMHQAYAQQILMRLSTFPMRPIQHQKKRLTRTDQTVENQLGKHLRRKIAAKKTLQAALVAIDLCGAA